MQGFNMGRYLPPDYDPSSKTSWNAQAGKPHALGSRASKLKTTGALTVRFETPFNIWCLTCNKHIAQGVRFNAEKKKIGNYYSTPIFSFQMKHNECGGWIEVHTDPKNTTYLVVEGGKRQAGVDASSEDLGVIRIRDEEEIARLENPFAKVEQAGIDKSEAGQQARRLQELYTESERRNEDPYMHSQKVRTLFRAERRVRKEKLADSEGIRERASLGIELLEESNEDVRLAKMVDFEGVKYGEAVEEARSRPLFAIEATKAVIVTTARTPELKKQKAQQATVDRLQRSLQRSTREKVDPFLLENGKTQSELKLSLKRTRPTRKDVSDSERNEVEKDNTTRPAKRQFIGLVDYGSESDE